MMKASEDFSPEALFVFMVYLFASPNHSGPVDIVSFMNIVDDEEAEQIKQDAYQKIKFLVDGLR